MSKLVGSFCLSKYLDLPINITQVIGFASNKRLDLKYKYIITFKSLFTSKNNILLSTDKKVFDSYSLDLFDVPIQNDDNINCIVGEDSTLNSPLTSMYYNKNTN